MGSNHLPVDYESTALPIELWIHLPGHRHCPGVLREKTLGELSWQ